MSQRSGHSLGTSTIGSRVGDLAYWIRFDGLLESIRAGQSTTPSDLAARTYRTSLSKRLASLPFEDVRATLSAMRSSQESASKALLIGSIVAGVDPVVKDGQVSQQIAEALVSAAMNVEVILPLTDDVVGRIEGLFSANTAAQPTASSAGSAPAVGTFKPGVKGIYFGQDADQPGARVQQPRR